MLRNDLNVWYAKCVKCLLEKIRMQKTTKTSILLKLQDLYSGYIYIGQGQISICIHYIGQGQISNCIHYIGQSGCGRSDQYLYSLYRSRSDQYLYSGCIYCLGQDHIIYNIYRYVF